MIGVERYRWPEGRSCAAVLSFDFDGVSPYLWNHQSDWDGSIGELEQRRFGPRQGIFRILAFLARQNLHATFYIPGLIAERYPHTVAEIAQAGHEIGLHGDVHERVNQLSAEEIRRTTERAREVISGITGHAPIGYRSPSWEMTRAALDVLLAMGVEYDSSLMGYDHPYWVGDLVEVPVRWSLDDAPYYRYVGRGDMRPPANPLDVTEGWRLELEGSREYGDLFMLTMHPWLSGHAGRLLALNRLVAAYRHDPAIWWTTAGEVAVHHRTTHPHSFRTTLDDITTL